MKDPKRIEVVLGLIKEYWYTYPNLRLGQIINHVADLHMVAASSLEDDDLAILLQGALQIGQPFDTETGEIPLSCHCNSCPETCTMDFIPPTCPYKETKS